MEDRYLPSSKNAVHVNTDGALIVEEDAQTSDGSSGEDTGTSSGSRDSRDIYLPKHTEWISHVAIDIGGSLAKVVYFSRAPTAAAAGNKHGAGKEKARQEDQQEEQEDPASSSPVTVTPRVNGNGSHAHTHTHQPQPSRPASPGRTTPVPNGVLGPQSIASAGAIKSYFDRVPAAGKASGDSASRTAVHGSSGRMSNGSASSINSSSSKRRSTNNPLQPRRYSSSSTAVRRGAGTAAKAAEDGVNGDERRPSTSASAGTVPEETDENGLPLQQIPGGWLNFTKFESGDMSTCIEFINNLIEASSASHNIPLAEFKARHVKIMATGGGAHLYYDLLSEELGVEVRKEEEMQCLIAGLTFFMEIPHEVFWYSDQLVHDISHPHQPSQRTLASSTSSPAEADAAPPPSNDDLPRPSPNPPQYSLVFDENPQPQFPCMLVNIGSGVSIIKIDEYGQFERISGTSLGGGTLWGLLSMLTGADSFDEMLALSEQGDNANVDMLVGDIYGSDYSKIGLKSSTIASSFGKVFRKGKRGKSFKPEDIAKSLLYAISNNIGQIAYMNAEKHNLSHIYFGGCFIRGHAATISTLSYAIRFWSKGTKKALFLRHEGYLGAIGAWLRNIEEEDVRR